VDLTSPEASRGRQPFFDLRRPGLVVLDAQRLFCEPGAPVWLPGWAEAEPRAQRLAEAFLDRGRPVVFTRHAHPEDDDGGLIARLFGRMLRAGDPWSALLPALEPLRSRALVVDKARHSALSAPAVAEALAGCDALVLAGVQTPLCVLATALDAARTPLVPVVAADACAARTAAEHEAALRVLSCGHAHVATIDEIVATFFPEPRP